MCWIASLFLLQRLKGRMSGDAHDLKNMEMQAVIKFFFSPSKARHRRKSQHSDRNITGTCTIICHYRKLGGQVWTWWFFRLWCSSSWTTQNSDHPGDYWSNSWANLGTPPDFSQINSWATGHLTWVGWVIIHEDLDMRKLSAKWVLKCLNVDQKHQWCQPSEQLMEFFLVRSKWFPVVIGDNGWNLVISLWSRDKATMNEVAA